MIENNIDNEIFETPLELYMISGIIKISNVANKVEVLPDKAV
jgi:hypothetical protein